MSNYKPPHPTMPQQDYNNQYYQTYAQPQQAYVPQQQTSWTSGWLAFNDQDYIKGLVLGAGLTFLLTNPTVQRALVKGAVTLWSSVQGGLEEVKEQIQDIKSEMSMKE